MKHLTRLALLLAICAAPLCALRAEPLAKETAVYAAPDVSSTVLVTLPAGAEPPSATATSVVAMSAGWQAIAINASLDIWVRDSDLNKELDIKPGSSLRAQPSADSTEMGTMVAGDVTELRGIQGKWVQMHITKKTTGYINPTASTPAPAAVVSTPSVMFGSAPSPAATPAPVAATTTTVETQPLSTPINSQYSSVPYAANQTAAPTVQQPLSVSMQSGGRLPANTQTRQPQQTQPRTYQNTTTTTTVGSSAPVATNTYGSSASYGSTPAATTTTTRTQTATTTVQPVTGSIGEGRTYEARPATTASATVPRAFEGTFASTRRAFMPRRPYDFQLTGPDGTRLVYVDLSKLTVTEQFETYVGRTVTVIGAIAAVPGTNDIVVKAETLQAK